MDEVPLSSHGRWAEAPDDPSCVLGEKEVSAVAVGGWTSVVVCFCIGTMVCVLQCVFFCLFSSK